MTGGQISGVVMFPGASTTGITAAHCPNWDAIKTSTSGRTITVDDTVIENEEITGQMTISASNVTIRCSTVDATFTSTYGITCLSSTCPGLLVENVEIKNCTSACGAAKGGAGNPTVWRRVHMHTTERDLLKAEGDMILEDSFLEGIYVPPPEAHNDAIQTAGPADNITIRRNRIDGPRNAQTSAYILKTDSGNSNKVLFDGNLISGGSYSLYVLPGTLFAIPNNVIICNNTWISGTSQFGAFSIGDISSPSVCFEWHGNKFDNGTVIAGPAGTDLAGTCLTP